SRRNSISPGGLALLISHSLPRLNLHLKSAKRMAVRTPPERPRRNPTSSLLPSRDSSTQYSATHLCYPNNQRGPSNTRRYGHCSDPTLLVSTDGLVPA